MSDASAGPGPGPAGGPWRSPVTGAPVPARPVRNGLAVASLVTAVAGAVPFLFGIPSALGVVFGFVALHQIKLAGGAQRGRGLAVAGIVIGFVLLAVIVFFVVVVVWVQLEPCTRNPYGPGCPDYKPG